MRELPELFLSVDLEMNQPSGRIIQIGAIVGNIYTGEVLERFSRFVDPNEPLTEFIINLTGIKQAEIDSEGVTLPEAYLDLVALHKRHKTFCNPITWGGGDIETIREQLGPDHKGPWPFGRRWIDVKTLYISHRLSKKAFFVGGLAKSMTRVGLAFNGSKHNALADAENTFLMYCRLLSIISPKVSEPVADK